MKELLMSMKKALIAAPAAIVGVSLVLETIGVTVPPIFSNQASLDAIVQQVLHAASALIVVAAPFQVYFTKND